MYTNTLLCSHLFCIHLCCLTKVYFQRVYKSQSSVLTANQLENFGVSKTSGNPLNIPLHESCHEVKNLLFCTLAWWWFACDDSLHILEVCLYLFTLDDHYTIIMLNRLLDTPLNAICVCLVLKFAIIGKSVINISVTLTTANRLLHSYTTAGWICYHFSYNHKWVDMYTFSNCNMIHLVHFFGYFWCICWFLRQSGSTCWSSKSVALKFIHPYL